MPQAQIDAAYARVAAAQPSVPLRSVQILSVDNLAASSRLEKAWKHGASWSDMQAMAKQFNANPVELDQTQQSQIPSPTLGAAVFAATPGQVVGPVAGTAGMFVFKVTDVSSSGPDAATQQAQIKQQLQLQMAQSEVAQDVDNLQDALAGQTPLDQLPGNLGLVALQGTLDANGNALDGTPAPIPGGDTLKAAILKAAFAAHVNDPAQLMNGPDGSYFALTVTSITPAAPQPYDQVQAKVLQAWTHDAVMRAAEVDAANLMTAVNHGHEPGRGGFRRGLFGQHDAGLYAECAGERDYQPDGEHPVQPEAGAGDDAADRYRLYRGGAGQDREADPGAGSGRLCPGAAIHGEVIAKRCRGEFPGRVADPRQGDR